MLIIIAFILLLLILIGNQIYKKLYFSYVKSNINGKYYLVQNLPDKQNAADKLAQISDGCVKLIDYLKKNYPEIDITKRLAKNYNPENVSEGIDSNSYTTYTVNKGEQMVFCLRTKGAKEEKKNNSDEQERKNEIHKLNILMFVAIHEMAHIASVSLDHTPEFRENFKFLLEQAINCNVYRDEKYDIEPKYYCGILVTDNPLKA